MCTMAHARTLIPTGSIMGSFQSMLLFPFSLDGQVSFPLLKPTYRDTEVEGWETACLASHFRYKFTYNLKDSKQITQGMLGMVGNWMGLSQTSNIPASLIAIL